MANCAKSKICSVCGASAIGKHFNAHTCLSCKVFFRRNALCNPDEDLIECAFDNDCVIDSRSRRFCSKCRLRKCFAVGMEKDKIKSQVEIKKAKEKQSISNRIYKQISLNNSLDLNENIADNLDSIDPFETNSLIELSPISLSSSMEEFSDLLQSCSDDTSFLLSPKLPESPKLCDSLVLYNNSQSNQIVDLNGQTYQNFEPLTIELPIDLKFLNFQLILSEKYLLKELTDACEVLRNPYRQMRTLDYHASSHTCSVTQHSFNRLIRMSRGLSRFTQLTESDQVNMLKYNLVDMFSLQTVLMYDPDRRAYALVDDNYQMSTLIQLDLIKPFCRPEIYNKFGNVVTDKFRHEWKRDSVIFDLLTAILLFTPYNSSSFDNDNINEEAQRYSRLLRRYLEIKYPTDQTEAENCFFALMDNLNYIRDLKSAVTYFLKGSIAKMANNTVTDCLNCRLNLN